MKVAIIGATGLFGEPVARKLKAEGHEVVVLARSAERARLMFGEDFEHRRIIVEGFPTVIPALEGCDAVHLNLSARSDEEAERVLWRGCENVVKASRELGIRQISMLAGNFDPDPHHEWLYRRYSSRGILAVKESGIPYMVFSCTWFQETLPLFIRNAAAFIPGIQPLEWHWVNSQDYARMVGHAYRTTEALNRHFIIHGPEPMTIFDALKLYARILYPQMPVRQYPIWQVKLWAKLIGNRSLLEYARVMEKFEIYGEVGDPHDTDALLGTPMITLKDWASQIARERAHRG